MSDISITITADPQQALDGINKVKQAGVELAETAKKAQAAADAAATDAMNGVGNVSREAARAVGQTGDAVSAVGSGLKTAANEAAKVSGAFGKAVPVVNQLGSAISTAITGPVGMISAAVGLALAQISKKIAEYKSMLDAMKASAGAQAGAAYDRLMQGRQDYAAQLQTLSQVREINALAQTTKLTADQLAQFRQLAGQIGIDARDVTASGIKSGKLSGAVKVIKQQRSHYATQEYDDYLAALGEQLRREITASGLNEAQKKTLLGQSLFGAADSITSRALRGAGSNMEEYKAYQDLYAIVKPLAEVRASYNRDKMLGQDQAALNAAVVDGIRKSAEKSAGEAGSGKTAGPTWRDMDKQLIAEEEARKKAAADLADREQKLLQDLDRQIEQQELIAAGDERRAFIRQRILQAEDSLGQLSEAQVSAIEERAGRLYDLMHPASPEPLPGSPEEAAAAPVARVRAARTRAAWTMPLDSLQRIGANMAVRIAPAVSPERAVMNEQLAVQRSIDSKLTAIAANPRGMYFT